MRPAAGSMLWVMRDGVLWRGVKRLRSAAAVAWLLLAIGLVASFVGAGAWRDQVHVQAQRSFDTEAASVGSSVTSALRRMDDLTVAARALIASNPDTRNPELAAWYRAIGSKRYPGTEGFGFVQYVRASRVSEFAAAVRADPVPGMAPAKIPFRVSPPGVRAAYCLIRLAVSHGIASTVPGGASYDLCSVPGAGSLLPSAASGSFAALSANLPTTGQVLIVSAPVYAGGAVPPPGRARSERMLGWITALFDVNSVLGSAIAGDAGLTVSISRAAAHAPTSVNAKTGTGRLTAVASVGRPARSGSFVRRFTLDADGRWVITISKAPRWAPLLSPGWQAAGVAAVGATVSLLVFLLLQVLLRGRTRALRLVAVKTEQLAHQALHDPLTGVSNRALVAESLRRVVARARRDGTEAAALFLDLDDFKAINDTFGHAVGDALLKAVAERISGVVREPDAVGRIGGDEFVVVLEGTPGTRFAETVAERLLDALVEPFVLEGAGGALAVSASIGVAHGDAADGDALLRAADQALYAAKARGKRRYAAYGDAPVPSGPAATRAA